MFLDQLETILTAAGQSFNRSDRPRLCEQLQELQNTVEREKARLTDRTVLDEEHAQAIRAKVALLREDPLGQALSVLVQGNGVDHARFLLDYANSTARIRDVMIRNKERENTCRLIGKFGDVLLKLSQESASADLRTAVKMLGEEMRSIDLDHEPKSFAEIFNNMFGDKA